MYIGQLRYGNCPILCIRARIYQLMYRGLMRMSVLVFFCFTASFENQRVM